MKAHSRRLRALSLHWNGYSVLETMKSGGLKTVPLGLRRNLTRSLIELKRNKGDYDFGVTQLKMLDALIKLSRKAKTYDDVQRVHRNTCLLGVVEKH